MPDNETNEVAKVALSAANASAITEAANAMAEAGNKLMQVLTSAGIPEAAKDEATADNEPIEDVAEEEAPEEKSVWRPSQAEVNYVSVSTTPGEACANCRWFTNAAEYESCHIISNYPLDILPTGYCDRHETITLEDVLPPAPALEAATSKEAVVVPLDDAPAKAVFERLKDGVVKYVGKLIAPSDNEGASFVVYKDAAGKDRWFARYTNNAEDVESDIFTEKAHDKYIARLEAGFVSMPELWFWHLKGTRHGQADKVVRDGHLVMAVGTFDDSDFAKQCIRFYRKNRGRIKLSHGSVVPKWARTFDKETGCRLLTDYNTFEITTLPPGLAKPAALFTSFEEEIPMAFTPETREFFVKEFGEDKTAEIELANEGINKSISDNLVFKDFADLVTPTETPTPDAAPASNPVAPLLAELIAAQAFIVKVAEGVATKQAAADKQLSEMAASNKALTDEVAALRKQLGQPPVRASEAAETVVSDTEKQAIIEKQPVEYDPAFPGMKVPMRPVSPL